jgi:hypothetical protein
MIVQWYEGRDDESSNIRLPDIGGSMPTINIMLDTTVALDGKPRERGKDCPTADIEIL